MEAQDEELASFLMSVLPNLREHRKVIEALKALGAETVDDLKFIKETDLTGFLQPIEARKIIAHIKATGIYTW